MKRMHIRTWVVTIGTPDSKDDYQERIKAETREEAEKMILSTLTEGKTILGIRPARKSKFD